MHSPLGLMFGGARPKGFKDNDAKVRRPSSNRNLDMETPVMGAVFPEADSRQSSGKCTNVEANLRPRAGGSAEDVAVRCPGRAPEQKKSRPTSITSTESLQWRAD